MFNANMEVFKDSPKEFSELFRPCFHLLTAINVQFSFKKESFIRKYWRFLYIVPLFLAFNVTLGFRVLEMIDKDELYDMENIIIVAHYVITVQAIIKGIAIIIKSNPLTKMIKDVGEMWRTTGLSEQHVKVREPLLKRFRTTNRVIYWISVVSALLRFITPLVENVVRRFLLKQNSTMQLPIDARFPFDPRMNVFVFTFVFVCQAYCAILGLCIYTGPQLMVADLCAVMGLELKLLCVDISLVKSETKKKTETNEMTIRDVVKRHQKLCVLGIQLDEILNEIMFIDVLFAGMTTCFFIYAGKFADGPLGLISNYAVVAAVLLNVLHICYYGEFFTNASMSIGVSAYNSLWYIGNKEYQKIFYIIINRSQTPCCLTSMKYAPVNLNMFSKVMSTTWSYISLMSTVLEQKN